MQVKAKLRNLRIAPRKVRLVADLIRHKRAKEAQRILNFTVKKASLPLLKLLNSALANAKNNFQIDNENLYISKILVDEGPKYKRWMPRARGSAYEIQKKTSHITLILDEIKETKQVKKAAKSKVKRQQKKAEIAKEAKEEKEIGEKIIKVKGKEWEEVRKLEPPKPKRPIKGIKRFFQRKAI